MSARVFGVGSLEVVCVGVGCKCVVRRLSFVRAPPMQPQYDAHTHHACATAQRWHQWPQEPRLRGECECRELPLHSRS